MKTSPPAAPRRGFAVSVLLVSMILLPAVAAPVAAQTFAIGDSVTVIQKPLLNIPALARPGDLIQIKCEAPGTTTGWNAELRHEAKIIPLNVLSAVYVPTTLWWTLTAQVPAGIIHELYDLRVTAAGGIDDTTWNSVQVMPEYRGDFYFVHITDAHMPDHDFSSDGAVPADSTEIDDMREVIHDLNLLNPEFVLFTGDIINEGELEDYLEWRSYSRVQHLLTELEVPVFLVTGNHDVGGWDSTPPPDGTARKQWWRFFGWPRLENPPSGAPWYTQNYSFDYGPVHFIGMESYLNYDDWKDWIYDYESFTSGQMDWLDQDLAANGGGTEVMFFHSDFSDQLNLSSLGVEMALSGHIHYDSGSLNNPPYDLTTDNICDGARAYRVIRVSGGTLTPLATIDTGGSGQNLNATFNTANDGTDDQVSVEVVSSQGIGFENGRLRFRMPNVPGSDFEVTGGTLLQVDDTGDDAVVHVTVDIPTSGRRNVTVTRVPGNSPVPAAAEALAVRLLPNYPNPFNPATTLRFGLDREALVRLSIYDLSGRLVTLVSEQSWPAGTHEVRWEGRSRTGQVVPSGVYLVQLQSGTEIQTRRIVLAK